MKNEIFKFKSKLVISLLLALFSVNLLIHYSQTNTHIAYAKHFVKNGKVMSARSFNHGASSKNNTNLNYSFIIPAILSGSVIGAIALKKSKSTK